MSGAADTDALCRLVEEAVAREVVSVVHRPGAFRKRTPVDVVTATLADGRRLELFVKSLGHQVHEHGRRDREERVYTELFAGHDLPVPRCQGVGDSVLLLEHVAGTPLHHHGLPAWLAAARALAHLHADFAARRGELATAGFLLRIDAGYLQTWAERAAEGVAASYPAELASRVARLTAEWDRVVDAIVSQPVTLVHNHLSAKNVVVLGSRICVVDWEMAGVGCALEDLVHLRYERLPAVDDGAVLDEYVRALAGTDLLPARGLRRLFAACELQRIAYKLGRAAQSRRTVEEVAYRVERAERRWEELV